jgi:hypothetical protein
MYSEIERLYVSQIIFSTSYCVLFSFIVSVIVIIPSSSCLLLWLGIFLILTFWKLLLTYCYSLAILLYIVECLAICFLVAI